VEVLYNVVFENGRIEFRRGGRWGRRRIFGLVVFVGGFFGSRFDSGFRHAFPFLEFADRVLLKVFFSLFGSIGGPLWGTHHAKINGTRLSFVVV
jgi:hypothetical protein